VHCQFLFCNKKSKEPANELVKKGDSREHIQKPYPLGPREPEINDAHDRFDGGKSGGFKLKEMSTGHKLKI